MLKTKYKALDRVAFKLLREAKQIIKDEFAQDLSLKDDSVLDALYEFAMESQGERLFEIFSELSKEASEPEPVAEAAPVAVNRKAKNNKNSAETIRIGDIVDGKRCVSMYRGKPVFEPV